MATSKPSRDRLPAFYRAPELTLVARAVLQREVTVAVWAKVLSEKNLRRASSLQVPFIDARYGLGVAVVDVIKGQPIRESISYFVLSSALARGGRA